MRDQKIDCLKALLIILVVVAHSGFVYDRAIELFHMPVFFMVSGYLVSFVSDGSVKQLLNYCVRKIKTIWLPYFVWNTLFTLFNNTFINLNLYSDKEEIFLETAVGAHVYMTFEEVAKNIVKGIFMLGRTEMGGAFWFLRTLFYVSVLFACVEFVLKKFFCEEKRIRVVRGFVAIVFLGMGFGANLAGITSIAVPVIFSCYSLYYLGYLFKQISFTGYKGIYGALVCVVILFFAYQGPGISLGNNEYCNPIYLGICAVAGWGMTYFLAEIISKSEAAYMMEYLGKHTLYVVLLHFLAFKIVNLTQILLYDYPMEYLAAFPVLDGRGVWWIVYTIVGLLIPVAVEHSWKTFKKIVWRVK